MRPSVNASSASGSPASPSSRGGGDNGANSNGKNNTGSNNSKASPLSTQPNSTVFLRPHVYSYTCRGALHMESGHNANETNANKAAANNPPGKHSGDVQNLQGLPLCNGIATKLRHVTTLPTARTADEAIQMFQQVLPSTKVVASNDESAYERAAGGANGHGSGGGGHHHHDHHSATPTRGYDPKKSISHSVSCYGSTDVNVLTVQEIETAPVAIEDDDDEGATAGRSRRQQQQQQQRGQEFQDPFEAMLGSVFGGSSGAGGGPGGIFGPFGGFSGGSTSRSVSQSTRVVNGQTITTKEVTTVDQNGKRHVEKETTIRNRDGTVEVIKDDGSGGGEGASNVQESQGSSGSKTQKQHMGQLFPPVATPLGGWSPFGPPHRIVRQSEPQVVAVVPECKLGVMVSNVETDTEGDTIASFRVGPVEVAVGDSYDIVEEDGDSSRHYGDGTATNSSGERRKTKKEWNMDEIEAKLLSTMDKTAASMKKNAEMLSDAVSDDFPSRILKGGERVVGNFDKTFDRMTKLASDLYGWASGDSGRK